MTSAPLFPVTAKVHVRAAPRLHGENCAGPLKARPGSRPPLDGYRLQRELSRSPILLPGRPVFSSQIFGESDGLVVGFVTCAINEGDGTAGYDLPKSLDRGIDAQLGEIASPELRPTFRLVTEPFAKRGARRDVPDP
jgi:hypothetical protein